MMAQETKADFPRLWKTSHKQNIHMNNLTSELLKQASKEEEAESKTMNDWKNENDFTINDSSEIFPNLGIQKLF